MFSYRSRVAKASKTTVFGRLFMRRPQTKKQAILKMNNSSIMLDICRPVHISIYWAVSSK